MSDSYEFLKALIEQERTELQHVQELAALTAQQETPK